MTQEEYKKIALDIPHLPGIYKYFDPANNIIYVGKAKNLRKRVASYFTRAFAGYKTHELVQRINRIEFTVVDSEQDAFFLENALIKEHQPKYNIDLKDDKSFPFIVIKKEPFPRVFLTRKKIPDGSEYLGPFTSVGRVRELLSFIRQHVPMRNCTLPLTERNIKAGKFKVCLEYHLGNCKGPCAGLQTEDDYKKGLDYLRQILKGRLGEIFEHYQKELHQAIEALAFEKAAVIQKKIEHLENYRSKSVIVGGQLGDLDVFNIHKDGELAYVNYLMVRGGTIVQTHTQKLKTKLDEDDVEVLVYAIGRIRYNFNSVAREIVVPFEIDYPENDVKISVGNGGDRKKLLELSKKNVLVFLDEIKRKKMLHTEDHDDDSRLQLLEQVMTDLKLPLLPEHIECFDNSNFQGKFPVSAMVCFKNGLPSKNDYRKFNVKTVTGINDFATMEEAVYRRYKRLRDELLPLPQLVIIDGGKGQLSAALQAIHSLGLDGSFTLVGLAKNEEEIFFPGDNQSLKLDWNSPSLKFIRRIRDEVHRFGVTFHRQQRSRGTFVNELETIKGIGKSTAEQLLKHFKSVKNVKAATLEEIAQVAGRSRAGIIIDYFSQK